MEARIFGTMMSIPIAVIEDDPVVRQSLSSFFQADAAFSLSSVAGSVEEFLENCDFSLQPQPSIVLLDIQLPGISGIEGIPFIKEKLPQVQIVTLTTFEESEKIFAALCAGACSYLSKRSSLKQIREALIIVSRGGSYMTPSIARKVVEHFVEQPSPSTSSLSERQKEIVRALVAGMSYKMVADHLGISIDTVRSHIKKIYQTLEINSKGELIKKSLKGEI